MKKLLSIVGIAAMLLAGVSYLTFSNPADQASFGSAVVGNDYSSYRVATGSTTAIVLKTGPGSLGSVIIASSTSFGTFSIYENAVATTSATSTRIASFSNGATPGTYTFDRNIDLGLVLSIPVGWTGEYIVTYR